MKRNSLTVTGKPFRAVSFTKSAQKNRRNRTRQAQRERRSVGMERIYYASFESSLLGKVFVASTEKGVLMVDFLKSERAWKGRLEKRFPGKTIKDNQKNKEVVGQLRKYLNGRLQRFSCSLDLRGTSFEQKVWMELEKIPYGETRSYKEIARAIGHPSAFRAVGNANGANSLPLILPCHRVIASGGGLGGYGHGLKIKKQLLDFEKARSGGEASGPEGRNPGTYAGQ